MPNSLVSIKPVGNNSYTDLPAPSTYRMTSTTLVDSARNTKGKVVATVVREGIRKVEISWKFLTIAQFSTIAKLFEGSQTGGNGAFSFYVKYFDTVIGDFIDSENGFTNLGSPATVYGSTDARQFYVGDRITDTAQITLDKSDGSPKGYTDVKLSLIEK